MSDDFLEKFGNQIQAFSATLEQTNLEIGKANKSLVRVEDQLNTIFQNICKTSLLDLSLEDLLQTSRIQFNNTRLSGKFDHPYNPSQFISTPSLEDNFLDFLRNQGSKPVFLLLANMGMGKTWNSAHLGIITREMKLAIPFFIPMHLNYERQLKEIFNVQSTGFANDIGVKCEQIKQNTGKKILFIFDGIDEYSENRQPFINFLSQIIRGYRNSVSILLTDRIVDPLRTRQQNQKCK